MSTARLGLAICSRRELPGVALPVDRAGVPLADVIDRVLLHRTSSPIISISGL